MNMTDIELSKIYEPSEDIVARVIEGELIIVPLVAGIGDLEDELFTLNETGRAIWHQLDGRTDLQTIVHNLRQEYDVEAQDVVDDVLGWVAELVKRRILVEVGTGYTA
jgi:hypothetical protein